MRSFSFLDMDIEARGWGECEAPGDRARIQTWV